MYYCYLHCFVEMVANNATNWHKMLSNYSISLFFRRFCLCPNSGHISHQFATHKSKCIQDLYYNAVPPHHSFLILSSIYRPLGLRFPAPSFTQSHHQPLFILIRNHNIYDEYTHMHTSLNATRNRSLIA